MTDLRTAAQQMLEALEGGADSWQLVGPAIDALKEALAEPTLQTCNCRWDGEVQVQQCTLHEAHVDAIHEWAERAKVAEKKLAALAEPNTCTWQQDDDSDSGVYGTSCGSYFSINDGTPEDNKMKWCCYCGKKLAQELITEDEDD